MSASTGAPAARARSEGSKLLTKGTAAKPAPTTPAQPDAMIQVLQRLPAGGPLAAYANAGYPKYIEGCYVYPATAAYFAAAAREMAAEGARLIGGCCGTTPAHVAAIAAALADLKPLRTKLSRITQARETAVPKI